MARRKTPNYKVTVNYVTPPEEVSAKWTIALYKLWLQMEAKKLNEKKDSADESKDESLQ